MAKCNCAYCRDGRDRRHENQHAFDGPEALPHRKKSKGSKANKWCRKKVGQEHDFSVVEYRYHGLTWRYKVTVCSRCHKHGSWKYQRLHEYTSPYTGEVTGYWV